VVRRFTLLLAVCVVVATMASAASARSWTALVPSASNASNSLAWFDTGTGVAGAPVTAGTAQLGAAFSPDGRTAYVVGAGSHDLTVIDMTSGSPVAGATVDLNTGSPAHTRIPVWVAVSPDGRKAYIADDGNNVVLDVDLTGAAPTLAGTIPVGSTPNVVAFTPDGSMAYVADFGAGEVTPIQVATDSAEPPITSVGTHPTQLAITPDGRKAYVSDNASNKVYPITLANAAVGTPITVGNGPAGIAITPDGSRAYVANFGQLTQFNGTGTTVTPIDLSNDTPLPAITVGGGPYGIAATPDSKTVYVTNSNDSTVTPIDTATNTAGTAIPDGNSPRSIAIQPDQAPVASFTVTGGAPGVATTFDASASTVQFGSITRYDWNFGDGTVQTTSTPTTTHVYAAAGTYTATVTETDSAGTSTAKVYTGQSFSQFGGPLATTSRSVVISTTTQPVVTLSTVGLDFGSETLGLRTAQQHVTVTNTGSAPLAIGSVSIGGADPGDFTVVSDGCANQQIAVGSSCATDVAFVPRADGVRSARLSYSDNATGSPQSVVLFGTGSFNATFSGTVTFRGNPVAGATVQACPTGAANQSACSASTTGMGGAFTVAVSAPPGANYSLTALPPNGLRTGQATLSPIAVPTAALAGIQLALQVVPSVPTGMTVISPSHGVLTSATSNPVIYWNEPTEVQISRDMFPAGGTVLLTRLLVTGTDFTTGQQMTKVVDVGGSIAGRSGNAVGAVVGDTPVSVTIPPLNPIHGQVSMRIEYQQFADGSLPAGAISSTQVLYEIYPPPSNPLVAAQPTDPLPAYFVNIAGSNPTRVGPGSITGTDAGVFSIVPLTSYGVPPGTMDCGAAASPLGVWNQVGSNPPSGDACGIAVKFTPPPLNKTPKLFYYATLDVPANGGGQGSTLHVALIGCDEDLATADQQLTGYDGCGGSNPPDPPEAADEGSGENGGQVINIPFVWVDPSGTVFGRAAHGKPFPLSGAHVTLLRSDRRRGPFRPVPNGSTVMSPANRRNPDVTGPLGLFGWDVLPGYYRISVTHPGCTSIHGEQRTMTGVLRVPPPRSGLTLTLTCKHLVRTSTRTKLTARRQRGRLLTLTAHVRGRRPTGLVEFKHAGRLLASVPVDPRTGVATITLRGSTVHGYSASYLGSAADGPSVGRT
jgi:YVTN family beta-propeller protein